MSKILLVDDSPDFLDIFHWSLKRKGYLCETAYYRERIFDKLTKFSPQLIIMDINLPGDDGRYICRDIKENKVTMHIPVILCSARHDLLTEHAAFLADDFIEKPFETSAILIKIEKLIPSDLGGKL
ncbi:MAG: response regulator [Ferruginibacter sp.]